jgi:hypothetical protein
MTCLCAPLLDAGFAVHNLSYHSRSGSIEAQVKAVSPRLEQLLKNHPRLHAVTHSLGGIIFRAWLSQNALPAGCRAVLLAPPNGGSEVASRYRARLWYRTATGPAGQQLVLESALLKALPKPSCDVAVIAGTRSSDPWFNHLFSGPHDGKVSVESTKLVGMRDHLEVACGHTFIMRDQLVQQAIVRFLCHAEHKERSESGLSFCEPTHSTRSRRIRHKCLVLS